MRAGEALADDWFPRPLPDNIAVGDRSWIYSAYAFLHYRSERPVGLRVGDDSGVYDGTVFDLGPEGEVEVGDFCALAGPTICSNGRVAIGDYAMISWDVVIADSYLPLPPDVEPLLAGTAPRLAPGRPNESPRVDSACDVLIGDNVWIGARAVVLGGARIEEGAIVGAAAVVDFPVPPFAIVAGNPATVVGQSPPAGGSSGTPAQDRR